MNLFVVSVIILGAVALACLVLFAFHRLGSKDVLLVDTTRGAAIYAVVGTSFAVLLAFVVLIAFEGFNDARTGAEQEADAVLELSRTSEFFPATDHRKIQGDLICYARAVARQDWPAMRDEARSPAVDHWSFRLEDRYKALPVRNLREQSALGNLLTLSDDRVNARRQRLTQAHPLVTTPVWFILLLGAALSVGFVLIFVDRRSEGFAVQAAMMGAITAVVVAGLLLISFLDHPFEDHTGSIKPVEMERSLSVMEQEHGSLPTPCTPNGDPRKS